MKLNTRILSIVLIMLMAFTAILLYVVYSTSKGNLYAEREVALKSLVELPIKIIGTHYKDFQDGKMTEEEAKAASIRDISELRYGKNDLDYFWINDTTRPLPRMIMHAASPQLNGKILDNPKYNCAMGQNKNLFLAAVDVCLEKGDGYVDYLWEQKMDDGSTLQNQPKISYVKLFEPWHWVVGSGIYVRDVNQTAFDNAGQVFIIAIVVFIIIAVTLFFIIRTSIVQPIVKVSNAAIDLSKGEFKKLELKTSGEIKDLVDALNGTQGLIDEVNANKAQADKLANNLQTLPTPVLEMDRDFNIIFMNDAGAAVVGLTPKECIGKKCYEIFRTDDCQTENCACSNAMRSKSNVTRDTVLLAGNKKIPITYTGMPIIDKEGNMTGVLEYVADQTPVYDVARMVNDTSGKVEDVSGILGDLSNQMSSEAEEMSAQSDVVAASTEEINSNVATVASSTEQAAANVTNMAAAAEEMSQNVSTVASAIEQMNSSLKEVARNTVEAATVAGDAAGKTETSVSIMGDLSEVAKKIGKVIKMISDIADQTNMLALNATIEAASAGEAGKGFAVVAAEVKELAKQTAESTEEISNQIENIQKTAVEASDSVNSVKESITRNREISQTIASSVEEQTATMAEIAKTVQQTAQAAKEVARNADEATKGVKEIARSSNEMSVGVQEVSRNIQQVNIASNNVSKGSHNLKDQANALGREVGALNDVIGKFTLLEKLK